jgi:DNA-binding response OmpR family regulator
VPTPVKDLILIVEDDPYISQMLSTYLSTKRYRLTTTPMGQEALPLCRIEMPSLVLLDINLPDIDGYEVCRQLRENLATSTLPILFLTQKKLQEDRLAGLRVGANDYITKPFDMEELYLRVRNAIHRSKHRAGIGHTSRLPEGPLVSEQLKTLLYSPDWAILSVRVENYQQFAEAYGHLEGKFVQFMGQLVRQAVDEAGNFGDFVGRAGTVHFIVVTTPARIDRLRARIQESFTRAMDPPNARGSAKPVTAKLRLSFGLITDADGPYGDIRSLSVAISHAHAPVSPGG